MNHSHDHKNTSYETCRQSAMNYQNLSVQTRLLKLFDQEDVYVNINTLIKSW